MIVGAVDVGATKVLVSLASAEGRLSEWQILRFDTPSDPSALVHQVAAAFGKLISDQAPDRSLAAVCVAAPGPLDSDAGVIVSFHNRDWVNVPLGQMLATAVGVPVRIEDDATAAALGEALAGAGEGFDPMAYLTLSSGIGSGLVIGGRSMRGAHGLAGEIGHLVIDPTGPPCGCGRRGDVEAYAGGLSLARRAAGLWHGGGMPEPVTAADVFALAEGGETFALALVSEASEAVSRAIAALAAVADPARIVVGGAIGLAHPGFVALAAERARDLCMRESGACIDVVLAGLGERSCLVGAAILATQTPEISRRLD